MQSGPVYFGPPGTCHLRRRTDGEVVFLRVSVGLSLCQTVCTLNYSKSYEQMFTKFLAVSGVA